MTPVHQEVLDGRRGDCVRACFATLLDLPLDHVPNFSEVSFGAASSPHAQLQAMYHWLRPRGLDLWETHTPDPFDPVWGYGEEYDERYVIASGPSMMFEGSKHVVVAERFRLDDDGPDGPWRARFVHDPSPCGRFIAHAERYMHLVRRPV